MLQNWWIAGYIEHGHYVLLASWIFWVIISITLHELAHGWAALRQGDDTPRTTGHMTPNPLVYMGPQALIVFALCGITWGAMPVNPYRFRDGRKGEAFVALAGPLMNILIAGVCFILTIAWLRIGDKDMEPFYMNFTNCLMIGVKLNIVLAILNMLPLPPLDGSRVLAGYSRQAHNLFSHPNANIAGLVVFVAVFFMTPFGSLLFYGATQTSFSMLNEVGSWIGNEPLVLQG